jgi:hypothetical protein
MNDNPRAHTIFFIISFKLGINYLHLKSRLFNKVFEIFSLELQYFSRKSKIPVSKAVDRKNILLKNVYYFTKSKDRMSSLYLLIQYCPYLIRNCLYPKRGESKKSSLLLDLFNATYKHKRLVSKLHELSVKKNVSG